jgi:hypothetical protein
MSLSKKIVTILLFFISPLAFAGTGSAEGGYALIIVLAGILGVILGTPLLIRLIKLAAHFIKNKVESYFKSSESVEKERIVLSQH